MAVLTKKSSQSKVTNHCKQGTEENTNSKSPENYCFYIKISLKGVKNMINIHYKKSCLKIKHNLDIKRTKGEIKLFMKLQIHEFEERVLKRIFWGSILMQ